MILYAFDKVKSHKNLNDKTFETDLTASDVIVRLFLDEVSNIVKKGVYRNYNTMDEDSLFIKGKIDVNKSFKSYSVKKHIYHDEYNSNNNVNLILKFTLNNLLFSKINKEHKRKLKILYTYFQDIEYRIISDEIYKSILLNKSNIYYDFAIKLSIFINKKIIPSDNMGKSTFINIEDDNETMSLIYEEFLRNFYKLHTDHKVSSKEYQWYLEPLDQSDLSLLPKMRTDIEIVIDKDTKILIDAKYYKNALSSRYEINKFISNNMYQINTYLEHNLNYKNLRGILLYPSVGYYFDEKYIRKDKYTIEFRTIDLNMDWIHIEKQLLNTLF
jgi:5-methylcytosine-specific restriction enzyme subunit McrC